MKRTYIATAALAVVLPTLLLLSNASAFSPRHGDGPMGEDRILRMIDTRELDATQREQVWAEIDAVRKQRRAQFEALRKVHEQLRELVLSGSATPELIEDIADEQSTTITEMIKLKATTFSNIVNVLTPDQLEKLRQAMEQRGRQSHGRWSN